MSIPAPEPLLAAELLQNTFPISSERFSLELVVDPGRGVFARPERIVVQLLVWDPKPDGDRTIRDIKEQEIYFPTPVAEASRLPEWLEGWRQALVAVFESQERLARADPAAYEAFDGRIELLMPHDLFCCADALGLKRAKTPADFQQAMLGSKKRLGAFLAPEPHRRSGEDASSRASSSS